MKEKLKWNSLVDGNWPVSNRKVLLSTIKYGTVIGYYDIEDNAFFILSGAKPQILHINEVIAWTDIPKCNIEKPTTNFRLPTKKEFEHLCECYTKFDWELKGRWFFDADTRESLFLPCKGYSGDITTSNIGSNGSYWSSTQYSSYHVYFFNFDSSSVNPNYIICQHRGHSVRLVSDEPFEGAIHVAGLYWKPENEEGYYTWDEAMEKFNIKN